MNRAEALMNEALAAKAQRRRALAALPYADKIRVLLRLQQMAGAIAATRGVARQPWALDEATLRPPASGLP